jgi:uncharacterized protein (DUF1015 family)
LPFRGLRYNTEKAGELSALICPPYDVMSGEERAWLQQQHEFNMVHLENPLPQPSETPEARFNRIAKTLKEWQKARVIQTDSGPALYVYRHRFATPAGAAERWSFFCLLRLSEYSSGEVIPHENTMARPKSERLMMLRACGAHVSPIMCLHRSQADMRGMLSGMCTGEPIAEAQVGQQEHALWAVTDSEDILTIVSNVEAPVFIADGHHRYEAALAYSADAAKAADKRDAANYVLVALIHARDPGLTILPAHRVLKFGPGQRVRLERLVAEHCTVQACDSLPALERAVRETVGVGWFDRLYGYRLLLFKTPPPSTNLEALHSLLLDPAMPDNEPGQVAYVVGAQSAAQMVERGDYDVVMFLSALPIEKVLETAETGKRLPKKATYFHPKLPAGLVMASAAPGARVEPVPES